MEITREMLPVFWLDVIIQLNCHAFLSNNTWIWNYCLCILHPCDLEEWYLDKKPGNLDSNLSQFLNCSLGSQLSRLQFANLQNGTAEPNAHWGPIRLMLCFCNYVKGFKVLEDYSPKSFKYSPEIKCMWLIFLRKKAFAHQKVFFILT